MFGAVMPRRWYGRATSLAMDWVADGLDVVDDCEI